MVSLHGTLEAACMYTSLAFEATLNTSQSESGCSVAFNMNNSLMPIMDIIFKKQI